MKQRLLRAYMAMRRTVGISSVAIPLWLTGCVVDPVANGHYRTTSDAPVVQQSRPISADLATFEKDSSDFAIGRRVALVIGNSDYSGSISPLANPANDGNDVAAALRRVGFEVDLQLDANRDQMKRAMLDFSQRLQAGDVGLFYYAGHAVQVNGRNFMIPIGANLEVSNARPDRLDDHVELVTVEMKDILGHMDSANPDVSIVIFDACRDNPFSRGTRSVTRGLAQTYAPQGTFVAYATAPGEVAEDGNTKNSPYTSALVETIETPGLKLEDVFKQVRRKVALATDGRQTPWENSSIFGDFYFAPPKAPEVEPAAVALQPAPEPVIEQPLAVAPSPAPTPQLEEPAQAVPTARKTRRSSINTTFITP